ncbi:Glutamate racemase [Peptoniphilus sp. ING2-D1G]|nr:Glutamate racemase [Peptoniphilus sp. ING2-D1G]
MNFSDKRPIGIFDSGVGGLGILRELIKSFPTEDFIYLADTARMPYGEKDVSDITAYTIESFEKLKKLNVKAAVLASNTSASYCLDEIKSLFDFPTLAVIGAAALDSAMVTHNKNILIFATNATAKSDAFQSAIKKVDSKVNVKIRGCSELVNIVESGKGESEESYEILNKYLEFKDFDYDTVLLGCTHLSFTKKNLDMALKKNNKNVKVIDPAKSISKDLKRMIEGLRIESCGKDQKISFYVSGNVQNFKRIISKLLDEPEENLDVKSFEVKG